MLRLRIRQSGASSDVHRTAQSYMAGRVTRLQEGGFAALEKVSQRLSVFAKER
jgi:hypothetical protein